jgi:hypothetical protein
MTHYSLSRTQRDVSHSRHLTRNQRDTLVLIMIAIVAYLAFQLGYDRGRMDERDGVIPPTTVWLR